jgi:hypothetical protein
MALTLIEAAKMLSGDVLRSTIIELFATQTDLLRVMQFDDIPGNSLKYKQEDTLPGIAFRGIGEGYTESTGVINPQSESLVIVGGDLDVDKFIVRTMGGDQRAVQEAMKLKALAHNFSNTFIKGDSLTTPKQFDGLQVRLTGAQVVSNSAAADGAGLSLEKLDETIDATDEPTHLFMSKKARRKLTVASRSTAVGGYITYELDAFGRRVTMYNGLPILIADANADLFATLGDNEAYTGGGTADGTSIYVLSMRPGMLQGIQNGAPEVTDLGELEGKSTLRTRVEWYTGMVLMHPRAAARLRNIDANVAVTA